MFCAWFLFGFAILATPWAQPTVIRFDGLLVHAAGNLIHLCGGHANPDGAILRAPSTGSAVEMKDGCNGVNVTVLLIAALLAFRAPWAHKAKGLLLGCVAIQSVNLVRFISLFYLLQFNRAWFDFAHNYLWESLIMLDALAAFWLWVELLFRADAEARSHVQA